MTIHFNDNSTLTTKETLDQCETFGDKGFYVTHVLGNTRCLVLWTNIKYIADK